MLSSRFRRFQGSWDFGVRRSGGAEVVVVALGFSGGTGFGGC